MYKSCYGDSERGIQLSLGDPGSSDQGSLPKRGDKALEREAGVSQDKERDRQELELERGLRPVPEDLGSHSKLLGFYPGSKAGSIT